MALVTVAAFLFFEQRDSSALIRKLVWSIVIPVGHSGSAYMVFGPLGKMTRILSARMSCGPEPRDQLPPLLFTLTVTAYLAASLRVWPLNTHMSQLHMTLQLCCAILASHAQMEPGICCLDCASRKVSSFAHMLQGQGFLQASWRFACSAATCWSERLTMRRHGFCGHGRC